MFPSILSTYREIGRFASMARAKGTLINTIIKRLDCVKEWTGLSLNEIWREPEDSLA